MSRNALFAAFLLAGCIDTEDDVAEVAQASLGGYQIVAEPSGVHSTWWRSPTAYCPAGSVLYGVGADHTNNHHILFRGVSPLTNGAAEAGAQEDYSGTTANWQQTAYGVCGPRLSGQVYAQQASASNSNAVRTVSVGCPPGLVVIGAGAKLRGGEGRVKVDNIRPTETTVTVDASEDGVGSTNNWDVVAHAICAYRPEGYELVEATVYRGWATATPATAACGQNKKVLSASGGIVSSTRANLRVWRMMPTLNGRAATVIASTAGGTQYGDVKAYAICATE